MDAEAQVSRVQLQEIRCDYCVRPVHGLSCGDASVYKKGEQQGANQRTAALSQDYAHGTLAGGMGIPRFRHIGNAASHGPRKRVPACRHSFAGAVHPVLPRDQQKNLSTVP